MGNAPIHTRCKTVWLATPKAFYTFKKIENTCEYRAIQVPLNMGFKLLRMGYAITEESARAYAIQNCPPDMVLRGVTRTAIRSYTTNADVDQIIREMKPVPYREMVNSIEDWAWSAAISGDKVCT